MVIWIRLSYGYYTGTGNGADGLMIACDRSLAEELFQGAGGNIRPGLPAAAQAEDRQTGSFAA